MTYVVLCLPNFPLAQVRFLMFYMFHFLNLFFFNVSRVVDDEMQLILWYCGYASEKVYLFLPVIMLYFHYLNKFLWRRYISCIQFLLALPFYCD